MENEDYADFQPSQRFKFKPNYAPENGSDKMIQFKISKLLDMSVVIYFKSKESKNTCKLCDSNAPVDHWHYFLEDEQSKWIVSIPELINPPTKSCNNCKMTQKECEQFKLCAMCQRVFYCSKICQVEDWKSHIVQCQPIVKEAISAKVDDNSQCFNSQNGLSRSPIPKTKDFQPESNRRNVQLFNVPSNNSNDLANNDQCQVASSSKNGKVHSFISKNYEQPKMTSTKLEPAKKLPIITLKAGEKYNLMVTFVETNVDKSKIEFYATKQNYLKTTMELCAKLVDKCPLVSAKSIETNKVYLVKHEDGVWYRGQVLREIDLKYYIKFIDFGNSEYIEKQSPATNFRQIPAGSEIDLVNSHPSAIRMFIRNIGNFQQHTFISKHLQTIMDSANNTNLIIENFNPDLNSYNVSLE